MPGGDRMIPQLALVQPLRRWDPEQINGYVLIGRLGAGAMGRVYLGRSAAGRLVAVKTIKIELADEPEFRTRFAQEVAAARRVSGAFTAAVIAADPEADLPWLATVYVPAPSLSSVRRAAGPAPGHGSSTSGSPGPLSGSSSRWPVALSAPPPTWRLSKPGIPARPRWPVMCSRWARPWCSQPPAIRPTRARR